jgi:2-dehydropantoate 2-reductase
MNAIRTIAIVGAGAMGAAYAAMFSDAGDFDVCLVARGARGERLKQEGLAVNGRHYTLAVLNPDQISAPADLILVALKHHHLAAALPDIQALAGEATTILSVMNGLESEEIIGAVAGMEKMVYAVAVGIDAVREQGRVTYANRGRIVFGVTDPGGNRHVARLRQTLERAGIACEVPQNILRSLWWKFMINVGINQASAVLRAPYGVFQSSPDATALMRMLMREVIALAPRAGIDLGPKDLEAWCAVLAGLAPAGKTSMLQDIEAGRKTEVEIFAGKVVALGERYGIPTPVNAAVLHILKVLENTTLP